MASLQGAAALAAIALCLYRPYQQAAEALRNDWRIGQHHQSAVAAEASTLGPFLNTLVDSSRGAEGRVFAGLPADWGGHFMAGEIPVYGELAMRHVPTLGRLYHAMGLAGEAMVHFNEHVPAHYRLFGIHRVAADAGRALPEFLRPEWEQGRFRILTAPGGGYFDVVEAPLELIGNADEMYRVNRDWLASDLPARLQHVLLSFDPFPARPGAHRLEIGESLPPAAGFPSSNAGVVVNERRDGEVYEARAELKSPGYLLFRMNFHPGWRATVDGQPAPTVMLSPAFLGVPLGPGAHEVRLEYRAGALKPILLAMGILFVIVIAVAERRGRLARWLDAR
jgi:hypothetical protein